jgi:acyl-CoA thioesterase-1
MIMKRTALFLGIVSIFCWIGFSFIGCDNGSPVSEYDATRPIVCLGDSLTAGMINGVDYPEKSWPAHLQEKVAVEVINAGVSGDKTADALLRLENDVLSKNPQIVLIALGGNDLGAIDPSNPQAVFFKMHDNLQLIINRVKGPNRKLYIVNYLSKEFISGVAGGFYSEEQITEEQITLVYNSIAYIHTSLATSNNIELIEDVITAEMYNSYMSEDGIHLNETGYEMATDIIFNALKPFLLEHNLVK